jgi:hypothetical protein
VRFASALVLAASIAGCSAPSDRWIPAVNASSIVLVERRPGAAPVVSLHHLGDGAERNTIDQRDGEIYALAYRERIDAPSGKLTVVDDHGAHLPAADQVFLLDFASDQEQRWSQLPAAPQTISALKLEELNPCLRFETKVYKVPGTLNDGATFLIRLNDDEALMGTEQGRFFRVNSASATPLTELATTTPHLAAVAAADGELWLLGGNGATVHGTLEQGFVPGPPRALRGALSLEVDGSHRGSPLEIFTLTTTLGVEYFNGRSWTILRTPSGPPPNRATGRIAWRGPGEAVLIGTGLDLLLELGADGSQHEVRRRLLERPTEVDAFSAVADLGPFGVIAATRYSMLFRRDALDWQTMPVTPTTNIVNLILPLPGGALIGGRRGEFYQWAGDFGYCPVLSIPAPNDPHYALWLRQGMLMAARGDPGDEISMILLSPLP